jgi:hypothetical protein
MTDISGDWDDQTQSETFDEDTQALDEQGGPAAEMKTFEEMPDVRDYTAAAGDASDDDDPDPIGEELDDDEIIELEAQSDQDAADIEDDDLQMRDGEAFSDDALRDDDVQKLSLDGEWGLDAQDEGDLRAKDDSEFAMGEAPADDAELEFVGGDVDGFTDLDGDTSAVMESDRLSDEDLDALGYQDGDRA